MFYHVYHGLSFSVTLHTAILHPALRWSCMDILDVFECPSGPCAHGKEEQSKVQQSKVQQSAASQSTDYPNILFEELFQHISMHAAK